MNKILILAITFASTQAFGAAYVETFFKSDGYKGWGKMEGTSLSVYEADRMRSEGTSKMTGAVLGTLMSPMDSASITRIDKKVMWMLDKKKKTYMEQPFEDFAKMMDQAKTERKKEVKDEKPRAEIKSVRVSVQKTGKKEKIGNFDTEQFLSTTEVEVQDLETKKVSTLIMKGEHWQTPSKNIPSGATKTMEEFGKNYAKALNLPMTNDPRSDKHGLALVSMWMGLDQKKASTTFEASAKELSKITGYPIRTDISWSMKELEGAKTAEKPKKSEEPAVDPSDAVAGAGGGLSGMFGRMAQRAAERKVEQKMEAKSEEMAGRPVVHIVSETRSISVKDAQASLFEVPAEFKKTEMPKMPSTK